MNGLLPIYVLAQTTLGTPDTAPGDTAATLPAVYHFRLSDWLGYYRLSYLISGIAVFVLIVALGWIFIRFFRQRLQQHQIIRTHRLAILAPATYLMLWVWHPWLMSNPLDYGALFVHKAFAAVMLFVAVRFVDWLIIVPLLTRGGRLPVPGFVRQIILIVLSLFVIVGYCSWAFGLNIDRFLAGSAVLSIVLGLALQETLGNFFSGMVMQASSPFQIGDWILCGGIEGRVVDMNWRAVTLQTNDDNNVLIPNSVVAKDKIVNYHAPTRATLRKVTIGVDYAIPPNDVKKVLLAAVVEVPDVLSDPAPGVSLANFADSAIEYTAFFWIDDPRRHGVAEQQVRVNIWYRLKQAGYSIPFPMRTVERVRHPGKQVEEERQGKRKRLLSKMPLVSLLTPDQRARLAVLAREVTLGAGQILYRQGDPGNSLYLLYAGSVESQATTPEGLNVRISVIEAPNIFGEYSVLTGQPRPTTMRAVTDIHLMELSREQLKEVIGDDPKVMHEVSELVARRAAERARLMAEAGAAQKTEEEASSQHTVLETMKSLFDKLHFHG